MNGDRYQKFFTPEYLMGPNSVRILEDLMACCPMDFTQQDVILDLGCGKGLASYAISDGKHFSSIIQPYTCFVGMAVKVAG